MAVLDHTETAFERLILKQLVEAGWRGEVADANVAPSDHRHFDADVALYPEDTIEFLKVTQPRPFARLVSLAGSESNARQSLLKRLSGELDKRGTVDVLRKGFSERGVSLKLAYFQPELAGDAEVERLYRENRLRVVRQIRFDPRKGDSLDLVLFVNGLPTATAELKNRATGQNVDHAVRQYKQDRDPKNLLLRRAFVHFAVDAELAFMTTRLQHGDTQFLPFNQGSGGAGEPGGKGNPGDPGGSHPTSYLWREVWQRDAWLELIEKFVFVEEKGDTKNVVFPRFHQWHVVKKAREDARAHGPGRNYLIQHSAGSGKSKEIAWLAHDLSVMHDEAGSKVFDKVVVITDRRVLDQQLQRQVLAFEQVRGTVRVIDQDSAQLREALLGEQARVIITTQQKFPIVLKQLTAGGEELKGRTYAIINDEAHSGQTGETATDVKKVLGGRMADDLDLDEGDLEGVPPELLTHLAARGRQKNLSFFAFTATPKAKTLELFGHRGDDGLFKPFHTYSMRQAIEEGFIVDVLRNYTTYKQLFRLEKRIEEDEEVPLGRAQSKLAAYAKFHPYAKDQKAAVIVEHYRSVVRPRLAGRAKAMVVTASRQEAVRYKQAIDRYVAKKSYDDVQVLVAFSGEVKIKDPEAADRGESYTEPQMNQVGGRSIPEAKLPEEFDKSEYGVLVVAEKYQTGFDQPLLVGMYVDKKLAGVNAVQTLSRLNRIVPGKEKETFVLDLVNSTEEIQKAFEPFYGRTEATPTDPNVIFDAAQTVRDFGFIDDGDLDAFAEAYFAGGEHDALSGKTQAAYDRVRETAEERQEEFRAALDRFNRFYSFLAQVADYLPTETEKLYVFSRFLLARLRESSSDGGLYLNVDLTHYRLEEVGTESIKLGGDDTDPLTAIFGEGEGRKVGDVPLGLLGELVALFNDRFGADLSETDAVKPIQQVLDKVAENEALRDQALNNDFDDFERGKEALIIGATLNVQDVNDMVLRKLLDDEDVRSRMTHLIMRGLYDRFNAEAA